MQADNPNTTNPSRRAMLAGGASLLAMGGVAPAAADLSTRVDNSDTDLIVLAEKALATLGEAEALRKSGIPGTNLTPAQKTGNPALIALEARLRTESAKFGAALTGETTGSTLVAAQRGSTFFRHLFNKMPQRNVRDVLIEAASDPEFMALLVEKPTRPEKAFGIGMQIHAYLWQAGISPFVEDEDGAN